MKFILQNNLIVPREEAVADIDDRGYQFGDGVYEVFRLYGGKPFLLREHLGRLWRSTRELGIELQFTKDELTNRLTKLIRHTPETTGVVYIQITRGVFKRIQEFPPSDLPVQVTAYVREMPRPEKDLNGGVSVATVPDIRWLRCDIKSLNLLPNILARQNAKTQACYEAIQHRGDTVTEGAFSNVYRVSNGAVSTHPEGNLILSGVTRGKVLELCRQAGVPVNEHPFSLEDLRNSDELFLTSTSSEVMPIVSLNGQPVGDGKPGEISRRLQGLYEQLFSD